MTNFIFNDSLQFKAGNAQLTGDLAVPADAKGLVIFSHGSGSSRLSPRNRFVAEHLQRSHFATLLFDLLTEEEDQRQENRFDIALLTTRLIDAVTSIQQNDYTKDLRIGLFGASTGAASALSAAAALGGDIIDAVVSRGGRPDLAGEVLPDVQSPTLLIVGGLDEEVLDLNRWAQDRLQCLKDLELVPDATHLFEEPGALEMAAQLATDWFRKYLEPSKQHPLRES
ncbi:dienelactone hydrolase family protein [Pontibacter sp. HSC-14F20]|uniref:dienelactone hydrolase family protein n=1 Tax=Pontibacter sp. HSC-14F20 TaxID=2864136 RepID=UPI001C7393EC|nr:dienelactone hydrolase family protein [Pontibacter sp. HSC-14F20]MBX0334111.1 dienelactone hydrolase family protein [Pontibacter sp. HSC-14F20]